MHPGTVPPPLFTASEAVLLVLILLMGTLMSKVVLHPWQQWTGIDTDDEGVASLFMNSYTYTQTLSRPVQGQPHLLVVDRRGDVEVHGADQSSLDFVVKKTIWAPNEDAARKLSDQLKIEVAEQAGRYILQSNADSLPGGGRAVRLDITARVPKGTSTEITAERGDVIVDGLKGEQALTTRKGDAHVTNVEGLVRVQKAGGLTEVRDVKGSLELKGRGQDIDVAGVTGTATVNGEFAGTVQFRNIAQTLRYNSSRTDLTAQKLTGRLTMEIGSLDLNGIDGPLELSTKQKDINLTDFKHSVKINDNNGDVDLRTSFPVTHPIDVDLKKGQIELSLPPNSSFQIEANSRHGEVECDFSAPGLKVVPTGESPSISGTVGKGGPLIRLNTENSTIRLLRQGGRPGTPPAPSAPPAPPGVGKEQTWKAPHHPRHLPSPSARTVSFEPLAELARLLASVCRFNVRLAKNVVRENWGAFCPRPSLSNP